MNKSIFFPVITLVLFSIVIFQQSTKIQKLESELAGAQMLQGGDIAKAQTIDSLQTKLDSLSAEFFPINVELGRYQVAFEIFAQRNPKAASQFGDIISNETE